MLASITKLTLQSIRRMENSGYSTSRHVTIWHYIIKLKIQIFCDPVNTLLGK